VTCDSAEPKSIDELKSYGVSAMPALKGKDSILFGIQWLQGCKIIIHKSCINAKMEISTYHWQEDANGNAIQKPVEKDDHLIDAGRYAHERDMLETWVIS
jgi:phage terminase large subunit